MKKNIILIVMTFLSVNPIISQTIIPLYPEGKIPNSKPNKEVIEKSEINNDHIFITKDITKPTLTVYLPDKGKSIGVSVIICPGGGYWILAAEHEGKEVAKKFNEMGITAFVLKYRLPDERIMINPEIGSLQDAQRAIQLVRERSKEWNINPSQIGIMGFSAGGHLASTAGTHFTKNYIDNPQNTSLRPDFMILIYPVISSDPAISHKGSFEKLLGKEASPEKQKEYSNELQITQETPPSFLVHASDDEAVKPENSVVFYLALRKYKIPSELHIYEKGGHGFGLKNKTTTDNWMDRCQNWLKRFPRK